MNTTLPLKILFLEDQLADLELEQRQLQASGIAYAARSAKTQAEFTSELEQFAPDVVLADYNLPDLSGLEALRLVRDRYPQTPVIFVTGTLEDEEAAGLLKAGATDYVLKDRLARLGPAVERSLNVVRERQEAQQALARSELRYRRLFENAQNGVLLLDGQTLTVREVNPKLASLLGYDRSDLRGVTFSELGLFSESDASRRVLEALRERGHAREEEMMLLARDGTRRDVRFVAHQLDLDGESVIQCDIADITESKRNEVALRRTNQAFRALRACNSALVHAVSEAALFQNMVRVITELGGYRLAFVGIPQEDERKTVRIIAAAGDNDAIGFDEGLPISWGDNDHGRGLMAAALRTGQIQINADFETNPAEAAVRDRARMYGLRSSMSFPLRSEGRVFAAISVYSADLGAFSPDEASLLSEFANDLAYGIVTLRAREKMAETLAQLERSVDATIQALGRASELRDPYTAGHQRRVAQLARAIAQKVGLPDDEVRSIFVAALVHDIGKIHVPAEILMKPGRISKLELDMLKMHPKAGSDILELIEFPWPVAKIVLQHHERLDGSGYPNGLKGHEILYAAKVLSVADVMESMMSHRPYRPSHPVEDAVTELENGSGRLYDATLVEACVSLFSQFKFE